jgi:hypothetical protein
MDAAKEYAPRPVDAFAIAGGLAAWTAIVQKPWTLRKVALNQYILALGITGSGKDIVNSYSDYLKAELIGRVPTIGELIGGLGELTSSQGQMRSMSNSQFKTRIHRFGEIGKILIQMTKPNTSPHMMQIYRHWLMMYSKSGEGQSLDEQLWSDKDKKIEALSRPTESIVGEGVIEDFDRMVGQIMNDGLGPRFLTFEYPGAQGELSKTFDTYRLDPALVDATANVAGTSLTLLKNNQICSIEADAAADALLRDFEAHCRHELNSAGHEAGRQIWNRSHLKAMKLAGAAAVGVQWHKPVITRPLARWATDLVHFQTLNIVRKFEAGDVGPEGGNESKQVRELKRVVREYIQSEPGKYEKSGCSFDMHRNHHFAHKYLSDRLLKVAAFRDAPGGASRALKRVIDHLIHETGELGNVNREQAGLAYNTRGKVYAVINENQFMRGDG